MKTMLEHLFGSRTRIKLLSRFLRAPDEPLYVRELTRLLGTQINAVRRELANLVRLGLLVEKIDDTPVDPTVKRPLSAKRKYYAVNKDFALLQELQSLFTKAHVVLERHLDQEIAALGTVAYLAFLGVFVGQVGGPVDIFIVGEVDPKRLKKCIHDAEQDLAMEINYSYMTLEEFNYRKDITDRFLYAILEAPKQVIVDTLHPRTRTGSQL